MTKEEIITLIRETLAEIKNKDDMDDKDDTEVCNACQKKAENAEPVDDTEKTVETDTVDTETVDKTETVETTDDMKDDEKKETVSNSCQKKAMNEQTCGGEEVKKQKEVIKEEVLNSAPNNQPINLEISSQPSWATKTGEDFWKELRKLGYRV